MSGAHERPATSWFRRHPHVHRPHLWDGYYEHCRCGACAGDRRDSDGHRCISFSEWADPDGPVSLSKTRRIEAAALAKEGGDRG